MLKQGRKIFWPVLKISIYYSNPLSSKFACEQAAVLTTCNESGLVTEVSGESDQANWHGIFVNILHYMADRLIR